MKTAKEIKEELENNHGWNFSSEENMEMYYELFLDVQKVVLRQPLVSGSLPSREDAYKEGLNRKRRHEKNIVWKAKIFAAGAMWAKMKLTGISDVIGNDR